MIDPTAMGTRSQAVRRFRKMALVTTALVGVGLLAATSFAFLQTNGSATTSITAGGVGSNNEFAAVTTSGAAPTNVSWWASGSSSAPSSTAPWTPIVGQVVSTGTKGDIAIVDATGTTGNVLVTLVLSNAAGLSGDYSYMNLPVQLQSCTVVSSACTWAAVTKDANGNTIGDTNNIDYLTLSNGVLSFLLPGGVYYELEIPTGSGSFYAISTSGGTLSPQYLINVQSAG